MKTWPTKWVTHLFHFSLTIFFFVMCMQIDKMQSTCFTSNSKCKDHVSVLFFFLCIIFLCFSLIFHNLLDTISMLTKYIWNNILYRIKIVHVIYYQIISMKFYLQNRLAFTARQISLFWYTENEHFIWLCVAGIFQGLLCLVLASLAAENRFIAVCRNTNCQQVKKKMVKALLLSLVENDGKFATLHK